MGAMIDELEEVKEEKLIWEEGVRILDEMKVFVDSKKPKSSSNLDPKEEEDRMFSEREVLAMVTRILDSELKWSGADTKVEQEIKSIFRNIDNNTRSKGSGAGIPRWNKKSNQSSEISMTTLIQKGVVRIPRWNKKSNQSSEISMTTLVQKGVVRIPRWNKKSRSKGSGVDESELLEEFGALLKKFVKTLDDMTLSKDKDNGVKTVNSENNTGKGASVEIVEFDCCYKAFWSNSTSVKGLQKGHSCVEANLARGEKKKEDKMEEGKSKNKKKDRKPENKKRHNV